MACALDMGKLLQMNLANLRCPVVCFWYTLTMSNVFSLAMLVLLNNVSIVLGLYKFEAVLDQLS